MKINRKYLADLVFEKLAIQKEVLKKRIMETKHIYKK